MTDQQINEAIAQVCNWPGNLICRDYNGNLWPADPPDFCRDLNAMHWAENQLGVSTNLVQYTNALYDMARVAQTVTNRWNPYGLPARYRAEAFLRTLGKWEEAAK